MPDRALQPWHACTWRPLYIPYKKPNGEVAIKIGIIKAKNTIQYDQDVVIKDKQGNLLWEGKAGDIARFTVDEPLQIEIDYLFKSFILYSYWAATGYGEIDPEKSKKYNVSTNYRDIVWSVAVIMHGFPCFKFCLHNIFCGDIYHIPACSHKSFIARVISSKKKGSGPAVETEDSSFLISQNEMDHMTKTV